MNYSLGEVCYWEIVIDPEEFEQKHSIASGKLADVFINLALDVAPSNLQLYAL